VDGVPPPEVLEKLSPCEKEALTTSLRAVVELRKGGEETTDKKCHNYAVTSQLTEMSWAAWSRNLRRAYDRLRMSPVRGMHPETLSSPSICKTRR
jgi:hypothetical protein